MQVRIECLTCGRFDDFEAQHFLKTGKSLCPKCEEDCLGLVDGNHQSVELKIADLTEDQKRILAQGKWIVWEEKSADEVLDDLERKITDSKNCDEVLCDGKHLDSDDD